MENTGGFPKADLDAGLAKLQFGHDVSVVENRVKRTPCAGLARTSIWPRRQRRGEPRTAPSVGGATARLQFGHDVSVVENRRVRLGRPPVGLTSIWPRRQRRGERPPRRACRSGCTHFNLATTSASWRTSSPSANIMLHVTLQFGHDVSVVENGAGDERPVDAAGTSIWPRRQRRGEHNLGARPVVEVRTSIWPRRQRRGERRPGLRPDPLRRTSIWPRRQRRGERETPVQEVLRGRDFNLATTSASWRTPGHRRARHAAPIFNLATTSASWRTMGRKNRRCRCPGSSIWPRRQRRGELPRWEVRGVGAVLFNLATTSASWRTTATRSRKATG